VCKDLTCPRAHVPHGDMALPSPLVHSSGSLTPSDLYVLARSCGLLRGTQRLPSRTLFCQTTSHRSKPCKHPHARFLFYGYLTKLIASAGGNSSDRICRFFLSCHCLSRERCLHTIFSIINIYGSLVQPVKVHSSFCPFTVPPTASHVTLPARQ
jgi:hypothetical protein